MDHYARRRLAGAVFVGLIVAALLSLISRPAPTAPPQVTLPAFGSVTRVYDGDTVEVEGVGRVRLIGIDAMDSYNEDRLRDQARLYGMPEARVRYWSGQASDFAQKMLDGKGVRLEPGPEARDAYGRVLAYVHVPAGGAGDENDFGLLMIEKGLATAYRRFDHPRRAQYLAAEKEARRRRVGLWADAGAAP